jgi:hypothetical protein
MADVGDVMKKQENDMQIGEVSLTVKHYEGRSCQHHIKRAWQQYKVTTGASTKYVKRFPGFVRLAPEHKALPIVHQINHLKDEIAACVQGRKVDDDGKVVHTRNHMQKHDMIHSALPRVMTSQLYRGIHVIDADIRSISFYWSRKHVPKRLDKEGACDYLKQKYDRPEEANELAARLATIQNSRFDEFAVPKIQHSVAMASLYNGHNNKKIHGTTPIIVVSDRKELSYNHLPEHEAPRKQQHKSMMFGAEICMRTHLHEVIPIKIREGV